MPYSYQIPTSVRAIKQQVQQTESILVLATGVFDLLHQAHLDFLQRAHQVGDYLLVGIESDIRVKKLKGSKRPIDSQELRLKKLTVQSSVDTAFILPEKFDQPHQHLRLIEEIHPDVLAVSGHTPNLKQKRAILSQVGGEVKVVYQRQPYVSTTQIINQQQAAPAKA